jgi:uncharacterized ion transporter superfamily protein YfcC
MSDNNNSQWHLSKSVPITFILAIIMQTVSLVWYVSSLDNNVSNNTKELLRQEVRIENLEDVVQTQAVTLARIDENINSIREMMQEIARRQ